MPARSRGTDGESSPGTRASMTGMESLITCKNCGKPIYQTTNDRRVVGWSHEATLAARCGDDPQGSGWLETVAEPSREEN